MLKYYATPILSATHDPHESSLRTSSGEDPLGDRGGLAYHGGIVDLASGVASTAHQEFTISTSLYVNRAQRRIAVVLRR